MAGGGSQRGAFVVMGTFRRLFCVAIGLLASGCASTQLNYNTADLANSLNSLAKKQIFFNLAQTLNDS